MEKLKYRNQQTLLNKLNKSKSNTNFNFQLQQPRSLSRLISINKIKQNGFKQNYRPQSETAQYQQILSPKFRQPYLKNYQKITLNKSSSSSVCYDKLSIFQESKKIQQNNYGTYKSDMYHANLVNQLQMKNNFSFMRKKLNTQTQIQSDSYSKNYQENSCNSKMDRLCEKLSKIQMKKQNNIEVQISQNIISKIQELNQKLQNQEKLLEQSVKSYKQKLEDSYKQMKQIQKRSQFYTSYRLKTILELGKKIRNFIQKQRNERISIQQKLQRLFEQKSNFIQNNIVSMIKAREEQVFKIDTNLQDIIPPFHEQLQFQLAIMIQEMNQLQKLTKKQAQQFKDLIISQNKMTKESQHKVQELLKKTVTQIKVQIQSEKRQRQKNSEKLMELFEQACVKLTMN